MSNLNPSQIHILNPFDSLLDGTSTKYGIRFPTLPPTKPFRQTQPSSNRPKKRQKTKSPPLDQGLADERLQKWIKECDDKLKAQHHSQKEAESPLWWDSRVGERIIFNDPNFDHNIDRHPQPSGSTSFLEYNDSNQISNSKRGLTSIWAMETQVQLQIETESRKIRSRFGATSEDEIQPIHVPVESKNIPQPYEDRLDLKSRIIHHPVVNSSNRYQVLRLSTSVGEPLDLLLPPRSLFLLTDLLQDQNSLPIGFQETLSFFDLNRFIDLDSQPHSHSSLFQRKGFDLILLDPPFPNVSASRLRQKNAQTSSSSYSTVDDLYHLWPLKTSLNHALEIGGLSRGTLVGCWVTNSPKCKKFILEKLFPSCNLKYLTELKWLKITSPDSENSSQGGEPIFEHNSRDGRKPFETLLLARQTDLPDYKPGSSSDQESRIVKDESDCRWKYNNDIGDITVVSVPLGHSRKPAVIDTLRPYLPYQPEASKSHGPNVLEFFSRNVSAGPREGVQSGENRGWYVSVGNESCLFNELNGQSSNGYFDL